jgi:hypothetical protein
MNRNDSLDSALRLLDPAPDRVDPTGRRALEDLDAILGTEPWSGPRQPGAAVGGAVRAPARLTPRRIALLGGVAAAATAVVVLMPAVTGGDRAFATWKAAPVGLSEQQRAQAGSACRARQQDAAAGADVERLEHARTAIAERRGTWTTVVLAGVDGFSALCVTDDSSHLFNKRWIGSQGTPAADTTPGARDLLGTDLGVGTTGGGDISLAAGVAGADVVGVAYVSERYGTVTATVSQGHFALWFPGDELMDASAGVDVRVTYDDGSTTTVRLSL